LKIRCSLVSGVLTGWHGHALRAALLAVFLVSATARAFFPVQIAPSDLASMPYAATGYVDSRIGGRLFRGSGGVARDPRLVYTCAHVLYDRAPSVHFLLGAMSPN
jgi:hypothetical protein